MTDEPGRPNRTSNQPPSQPPNKKWVIAGVIVIVALSVAGWLRLRVDSSLEPLLPQNSEARATIEFLRDSSFASKAVLWFQLTDPNAPQEDLFKAADAAEQRLDRTLIKRVIKPPGEGNVMDEIAGLLDHAGELLNADDLAALNDAVKPDALKKKMRQNYLQLTRPEGTFMQGIIRRDPLGVSQRVLGRLYTLTQGMGYKAEVKNGYFVSPDGRQLMLVLETATSATSFLTSAQLVDHLNAVAAAAPGGVKITVIAAQNHTAQNDSLMKRDMNIAGVLDAVGFILLFVVVCRDWRVAAVFLLPLVAIALSIGICALIYPNLSAMVIGLSATMAGSAIDYGIYVYTALFMTAAAVGLRGRINYHLLFSLLLTTIGVFIAFLFSHVPAYRQLGWLTCLSLLIAMAGSVYVLPLLIRPGGKLIALGSGMKLHAWGRLLRPAVVVGAVAVVVMLIEARHVNYNPDLTKLDGTSAVTTLAEHDFQSTFSKSENMMAMLVVAGPTADDAANTNDAVIAKLSPHFSNGEIVSLSSFWPSPNTRAANLAQWKAFWTPEKIASVKADVAAAGEPFGFSADAYEPFFASLTAPPPAVQSGDSTGLVASIQELFQSRAGGQFQSLSYFDDTEANVTAVRAAIKGMPGVQVVSQRAMGQAFAESAVAETKLLVGISVAFTVVSLLSMTRSILKSILIFTPPVVGVLGMLAALALLKLPMNVVTVIAAIMVMAMTSDYGIFTVFAWDEDEPLFGQRLTSMHLSFITTLIGTGSLIFAKHPALFMVGVSLTSGLTVGYLTALLVLPGICDLLGLKGKVDAT